MTVWHSFCIYNSDYYTLITLRLGYIQPQYDYD